MARGYMGRLLAVDLSSGTLEDIVLDERICRDFIGGYGIGARLLYERQKPGVDALGPENTLGIITGVLTGTPATFGCRFAVVGKSPLTGGWGDANCGGEFGPYLKFAGYDGILITGISEKPVYLLIDNGKAEIKDASTYWGKSTYDTEDGLEAEYGKKSRVMCIGPAGEKQNLVSCIITHRGSAAGRSGLGAVMGSKRLKAVVVRGEQKVPLADPDYAAHVRRDHMRDVMASPIRSELNTYGTWVHTDSSAHSGDTPARNWGGVGVVDMPDVSRFNRDELKARLTGRGGCWRCPVACRGFLEGERYPKHSRQPEYETFGSFGVMCLNNDPEAVIKVNYICNGYGLDTISTGTIVAFAMECWEHGIITAKDTSGIDLTWGNAAGLVGLTEAIARREGIGAVFADGVRKAAERLGGDAVKYAVHVGGQEVGMHDPKCDFPAFAGKPAAARYQMDATPGRHTAGFGPSNFQDAVVNAAGLCMHSDLIVDNARHYLVEFMKAVTGWDRSLEELFHDGERILVMRHLFSLRENDNPLARSVHPRIIGVPPQTEGPLAGVTCDIELQRNENLDALDWDRKTAMPTRNKLRELGLDGIITIK